jgi:hypothetical protein
MTSASQALIFLIITAAIAGGSWYARGWYDGTLISRTEADLIAQGRADQAAKSAVDIERATVSKNAALKQLSAVRAPVSHACPPGTGAVSDEAFARFKRQ